MLLANRSLTIEVFGGTDEGMDPSGSDVFPIDPLGSVTVDGSEPVWLRCADGTGPALVVALPGGISSQVSPALIQEQLNALGLATAAGQVAQETAIPAQMLHTGQGVTTELAALVATGTPGGTPGGVPLQNLHNQIFSQSGTVAANAQLAFPAIRFTQPGWELFLTLQLPAAATVPFPQLAFTWVDAATANMVATESWGLVAGSAALAQANTWQGNGPAIGNELLLSLTNADTAQALTYAIALYQVSQFRASPDIRLNSFQNFSAPSFSVPDYTSMANNLLGQRQNTALATGASDGPKVLPTFAGDAMLFANTTSGLADLSVIVSALGQPGMSNPAVAVAFTGSTGNLVLPVTLPRVPCSVNMTNHNAGTVHGDWALVTA